MAKRIFISYRRSDSGGEAGRLYDQLRARQGNAAVFRDVDKIQPGTPFAEALNEALDTSDTVLVVIGPDWLEAVDRDGVRRLDDPNDLVRLEVEKALGRDGLRTIPVLVGGAAMPSPADLPEPLRPLAELQAFELRDGRFEDDMRHLCRGFGGRSSRPWLLAGSALALSASIGLFLGLRSCAGPEVWNQNTEIVLDASQRMAESFGDGTRLSAAESALAKYVGPRANDNLALRTFGGACDARSRLALGFGTRQTADIIAATAALHAEGEANLASAVIEATGDFNDARRFPDDVGRRVVVFTAGSDTCADDAVEAIRNRMAELGVDVPVDFYFIGLGVPESEREDLQRIADASGGRAVFTETISELEQATRLALDVGRDVESGAPDSPEAEGEEERSDLEPGPAPPPVTAGQLVFAAPTTVSAGAAMSFDWKGPDASGDRIFIAALDLADTSFPLSSDQRHETRHGPPATLVAPAEPGEYEIRYFSEANGAALFRQALTVTEAGVRLGAPAEVAAGEAFELNWQGPAADGDLLFIASPQMEENHYYGDSDRSIEAASRPPATLVAPAEPGEYEIRYFSKANGAVLFRQGIRVGASGVNIEAPDVVAAGQQFSFRWQGPAAEGDYLFIAEPDLGPDYYYSGSRPRHATRDGEQGLLEAPGKPGAYEIRYFSKRNGRMLAKRDLIVQ